MSVSRPVSITTQSGLAPGYELFIVALSILSIGNVIIIFGPFEADTKSVAFIVDSCLSLFFMVDFAWRLRIAPSKRGYFIDNQGWLDLLGSLPVPSFRLFRSVRVFKAIRRVRALGGRKVVRAIVRERAQSALLLATFLVIVVMEFGSIFVVIAEREAPNANIKSGGDALWWAIVSVTTVGYGDKFPVTAWGRIIGGVMLISGVGLFGVFTGYVARVFLAPPESPEQEKVEEAIAAEVQEALDDD